MKRWYGCSTVFWRHFYFGAIFVLDHGFLEYSLLPVIYSYKLYIYLLEWQWGVLVLFLSLFSKVVNFTTSVYLLAICQECLIVPELCALSVWVQGFCFFFKSLTHAIKRWTYILVMLFCRIKSKLLKAYKGMKRV